MMKKLFILISLILISSCAKEEFATQSQFETNNTPGRDTVENRTCSNFTYVRPPVDLLFVWDNSTSTTFISNQTKNALNDVVNYISDRFDYNVMLAPLIGSGNNDSYFFSRSGHTPGSGITTISQDLAATYVGNFTRKNGSAESGLSRVVDLLRTNQSNGVFRDNAYQIVILMSNDDDNSWVPTNSNFTYPGNHPLATNYMRGKVHDLLCMRGNYNQEYYNENSIFNSTCSNVGSSALNSAMMRFISVSANSLPGSNLCSSVTNGKQNWVYKGASELVFSAPYSNLPSVMPYPFNPQAVTNSDKVDICNTQFSNLFDSVNNAITDAIINHEYDYWPVADSGQALDPNSITVQSSGGRFFPQYNGSGSGFEYVGIQNNRNTRFAPTPGEPFSGHMIRLHGDSKVTYPECLLVNFQTPQNFFGYVHMSSKPQTGSIQLKINGQTIPESFSNGWKLLTLNGEPEFKTNFNIKIVSQSDFAEALPAQSKTGYFLKLNGNAVYTDGASVEVNYLPTGN